MLFQKEVAKVGRGVEPETMELDSYMLSDIYKFKNGVYRTDSEI